MIDDIHAFPVMEAMLNCLQAELIASQIPVPGYLTLAPGLLLAFDVQVGSGFECGEYGWVRLVSEFPSRDFPEQDIGLNNSQGLALQLEVGIVRCIEGLDPNFNPPTPADYREQVRMQLAEMAAMRRAICKCLQASGRDFILSGYTPTGPQGLLVGGTWVVTVRGNA